MTFPKSLWMAAALSVAAAFTWASHSVPVDAQETFVMKVATVAPDGTPWEAQLRILKRHIESQTNGRVRVKMFMGGSLGGEKALVRRVSQGTLQAFGGSTAALGSIVPEMNVFESPYLFDSAEQAYRALDTDAVKNEVRGLLDNKNFVFGLWAENGFRSWFTKERPVRAPADLQGLRMRSQEAQVHLETYRAVGASPVPIDVTNVLQSLQTGVVDGFDNTPLFAFATSWYQSAKHLVLSRHSYQAGIIVYSKQWFESLPEDIQQVLVNVPQSMVDEGRQAVTGMDPILVRNLGRAGIEVHEPTTSERQAFKQATQGVADRVAAEIGASGRRLLRVIRAAQ